MIITGRTYLEELLAAIGVPKIFYKLSDLDSAMKPASWALLESPNPEEYTESRSRELFTDTGGIRTYHIKDYDCTVVLTVRIGTKKDETANNFKRAFLKGLKRYIADDDNYRISITALSGALNPSDYELTDTPHVLIRVRFEGGLWRREDAPLIQVVVPEGEIVKKNEIQEDN